MTRKNISTVCALLGLFGSIGIIACAGCKKDDAVDAPLMKNPPPPPTPPVKAHPTPMGMGGGGGSH